MEECCPFQTWTRAAASWSQRSCDARIRGLLVLILILFIKNVMPKLDSAASEHVVWSEKFLDNHAPLGEQLLHGAVLPRRLVLLARALWFFLHGYLMVHEARLSCMTFYTFLLCVSTSSLCLRCSQWLTARRSSFQEEPWSYNQGVLVGYSPDTGDNNNLYPLLCTIARAWR